MRLKLVRIFAVLLLAGLGDARPQQFEVGASLHSEVEDSNAQGWRPVIQDANVPQKPISTGKDLPQVIEGNSRYTEATRRKSYYVMNNLFYEDHVVLGSQKNRDYNNEELDSGVLENEEKLQRNIKEKVNGGNGISASESSRHVKLLVDSLLSGDKNVVYGSRQSSGTTHTTGQSRGILNPSKKKVRNFIRLIPAYSRANIPGEKPAYFIKDLRDTYDQVLSPNLYQFESNSDKSASQFHRPVDKASDREILGMNNSREIWLKLKSHVVNESSPHLDLKIINEHNNISKTNVKSKTNSSQTTPGLNLKNWPNDNLQNDEDLLNYEKYTSFHDGDEDSETQEVSDGLDFHQNPSDIHHQIIQRPSNDKPSLAIIEHALPLGQSVVDPGSQLNQEESAQEATQWEQIPSFGSNDSDFPISNQDENSQNDFGSILNDLQPNRPLSVGENSNGQSTDYYGNSQGENSFPLVIQNDEHETYQGQEYYGNDNQDFVFNNPSQESAGTTSETNLDHQNGPISSVSQNTVVHILNVGQKRPNVTVSGMKIPYRPGMPLTTEHPKTEQKNSSAGSPNVHIMFTVQEIKDEEGIGQEDGAMTDQQIPEVSYDDGVNCPTVTIHSYTRINNTIQGKEGCTDLNIVINSHVLNTNVFKPGSENTVPNERYPGSQGGSQPNYAPAGGVYGASGGGGYPAQNEFQNFPTNDGQNFLGDFPVGEGGQFAQQIPGTSTFEVFQQTQINVGSQNDESSNADSFDPGVSNDPSNPGDGFEDIASSPDVQVPSIPSSPDMIPETGIMSDPVSLTEVANDPLDTGIPAAPPLGGIQLPLADAGPADVLADVGSQNIAADTPVGPASGGSSGIGLPGLGNPLSGITSQLSDAVGNLGSSGGTGGLDSNVGIDSPGSILGGGGDDDDDEDDDEMLELMPFSIMESMTSMLPFFTLLNPLNYGFLSIAISPLAVAVAGLFGLAAAFVPWTFRNVLDFGRSANQVNVRFKTNLEDVVKQSIHKYRNWNEWKSKRKKRKRVRVSDTERDARNLPDMKQALKTVTTQLLNVSDTNESVKKIAELKNEGSLKNDQSKKLMTVAKIEKIENSGNGKEKSKIEDKDLLIKEINSEISSLETMGVSFGRPLNSKFGYFETSHPGEAMAMTDDELEKELSSKRDRLPYGTQPTTSGGISTWILLNSPTTTPRTMQKEVQRKPETINKFITKPTVLIEKVKIGQKVEQNPTATVQRVAANLSSGKAPLNSAKPVAVNLRNSPKVTTTIKPPQTHQIPTKRVEQSNGDSSTTMRTVTTTQVTFVEKQSPSTTERPSSTPGKKFFQAQRTTQQKLDAPTTTVRSTTKVTTKVNLNRGKYSVRTTTTSRPIQKVEKTSSATVEKVTFRPIQMITTPKGEIKTNKPAVFVTKETPVPSKILKTTPAPPVRTTTPRIKEATTVAVKTDFTGSDLVEVPVQTKLPITKVNVSKSQMKKPVIEAPKVEIQSTKVNAASVSESVKDGEKIQDLSDQGVSQVFNNSQIDLQLDFNPELTKIEIQDATESPSVTTTTKKPKRSSHKRRKNKNKTRRRRPSSTTTESNEIVAEPIVDENAIQESKIEPETKEGTATKNKNKKQVQKPIGTQIYNFLSREVMPSFGVVSLVGLGLGIASYFFYPFGGGIARRNYEVEPNYKYNLGEYGGNYGQNEEEVFSKVLQGMTNHEDKYGGFKDYDQNSYYRYQKFGAPTFSDPKLSKKNDNRYVPSSSSGPTYKPMENTYDLKYRNTEFKYPEVATTPNYFERQKQSGYTVSSEADVDRQFVVGSVPKEYGYDESPVVGQKTPTYSGNSESQTEFDRSNAQSYVYPKTSANVPLLQSQPYGQPEALPLKSEDNYEEIEITPTAVAVEHGPRALKVKRSIEEEPLRRFSPRLRRESVIQVIPPTGSLEVDEKEEDLSNEIFDILDLMIPGKEASRKVKEDTGSNAIDSEEKTAKKKEGEKSTTGETTTQKLSGVTGLSFIITTTKPIETSSIALPSSTTETQNIETTSVTPQPANEETTVVSEPKDETSIDEDVTETEGQDLEETTLEWIDASTTEQPVKEEEHSYDIIGFVKRVAEIKFRLGLTILKHASEGFARYLGGVQKRFNGEE